MPHSPIDVILDVLSNGRVQSVFSHQSLAQQILGCFAACRIHVSTEEEREASRRAALAAPKRCGPIEVLRYTQRRPTTSAARR
jgi:hypothetical protein